MTRCPVCQEEQNADQVAFNHHVNSHFAEDSVSSPGPGPSRMNGGRRQTIGRSSSSTTLGQGRQDTTRDPVCCPICSFPLSYVSSIESTRHVDNCLSKSAQPPSPTAPGSTRNLYTSPIDEDQEFIHDSTTPLTNGQSSDDNWVEMGWDGPARPNAWSQWVGKKVDKSDKWWDPVNGTRTDADVALPSNFAPGVIPVLHQILQRSSAKGHTRHAVLSRDVVFIKASLTFDIGWGCGYRNALMAITSLVQAKPAYRKAFSINENGSDPGVRRIQGWIEEAWAVGFDPEGKQHFKGKMLGTHKWIGTSDLYAMFSYKGIPCTLYDFVNDKQKPTKNAHNNLVRWVKEYFDHDRARARPGESAFNIMMRTTEGNGRGESTRLSSKFPLVLQHSGHSRLIIGYEETSRGEVMLLVLDPGKSIHKDIRSEGIAGLTPRNRRTSSTSITTPRSRPSSRKISHESLPFARPYTNGESEITDAVDTPQLATSYTVARRSSFAPLLNRGSTSSLKPLSAEQVPRLEGGATGTSTLTGEDGVEEMDEDEEDEVVDEKGWVRKKVKKVIHPRSLYDGVKWKVPDAIQPFRVSAHHLSNHDAYQVLEFTGGPPLSEEEKQSRKKVKSTCIK